MGRATEAHDSAFSPLPPGLLITGRTATITQVFPALVGLQPVKWRRDGLLCSPRAAPDLARQALRVCPLPVENVSALPGLPSPPSAWIAGWYLRSSAHAVAPAWVREIIQDDGEGFGPWGHPTTALCLAAIPMLPSCPAVDIGCGSGVLCQAWARHHGQSALAVDLDPRAVMQTRRSVALAGLAHRIVVRKAPLEALEHDELDGRVLLANIPRAAHESLLARVEGIAIRGAVLSGLRIGEGSALVRAYRRRGLRPVGAARAGRWERWTLVRT